MTNKKAKAETQSPLRTPKPKNKLGLSVPKITMPHEIFVKPENSFEKDSSALTTVGANPETLPSQTRQTSVSSQTRQTSHTKQRAQSNQTGSQIAPERNFQKVPNSIVKVAIPAGIFKGKSKLLYDVLYAMTRGAVVPRRTARARKTELMKKASIGSRVTFDANMQHLIAVGLIREKVLTGEHEGNEFEVYTVEEIETLPSQTSQTSESSLTRSSQNVVSLVTLETSQTRQSLNDRSETTYENFKTLFKDFFKTDDEEPLIKFVEKLNAAAIAATGKDLTRSDFSALVDIADLIVNETEAARSRTSGVSVYLKFAAENLRRRLYAKNPGTEGGKSPESKAFSEPSNSYEPEPLGDERIVIIESLRRIAEENGLEAVKVFCGNYTKEDWEWLMNNL